MLSNSVDYNTYTAAECEVLLIQGIQMVVHAWLIFPLFVCLLLILLVAVGVICVACQDHISAISFHLFQLLSTALKTLLILSLDRFPKDAVVLLLLLVYFPVGICLTLIRIFIGVHVFLVSCALPESFIRRQVF